MPFWAHSGSLADRSDWQLLPDHLQQVADLASALGAPLGLARTAHLAGLFHDLGKYDPAFDRRLRGEAVRVDHSTAGGAVLKASAQGREVAVAEALAYAILGHHAGLPDRASPLTWDACLDGRLERFGRSADRLDPSWQQEMPLDFAGTWDEIAAKVRPEQRGFDLSLAVRMIFSCLVDADFRDTERFYAQLRGGPAPDRIWPALQDHVADLVDRFDTHMAGLTGAGEINHLRRDILAHVRGRATLPPGLFTLTVPTGGGKTLASLGFALDHARLHGHSRIVYAIPFTSIIDQTAAIFRGVLGKGVVLEHHSALDEATHTAREADPDQDTGRRKLRLAMEDWAAPVVVTTNVQLFESLFAARPSRARKLHNVANSVIVLDEAQTIPRPLLVPCVRMIDALARHYGCTIVLCTATQPAFGQGALALPIAGRELAPDPKALATKLRRARVVRGGEMDDPALVKALGGEEQALVIVNSRRHALELFRGAQAADLEGLVHLTTRQCAAHRRVILAEMRRRLAEGQPCRVVATSLIEAGVDVDFPRVWRAEAGLDQIVQAAGRCNREGRHKPEDSLVTVFRPAEQRPPPEIAGLVSDMQRMIDKHSDLLSLEAMEAYFEEVYWRMGEDQLDAKRILDRLRVSRTGTDFAFRTIAEDFRMVESEMAPVIVPWDEQAQAAIRELGVPDIPSGRIARALQTYLVQVPLKDRERLIRNGHAAFERPDLRGDQFEVLTSAGRSLYREDTGLEWERADELAQGGII